MADYTFSHWVNNSSSSYYLGFDDNATKLTTTQLSLSDDVYTRAAAKILWFSEVDESELVAERTFRFGSSQLIWLTTTIPAATVVAFNGNRRWMVHTWTADDPDGTQFGNQNTTDVAESTRTAPIAPDDLNITFTDPALARLSGSYIDDANTFGELTFTGEVVVGDDEHRRKWLLGYI